ncbi:TolC family protein (plasmid) [Mesorhizobium sp. NBSH29]|uniref:TolC family protein n=1 Tax=Mesorhizobium sp. NBSH29 TaxID=2654249 RepID=UPI00189688EB|nr:TolC family protein [Mesorhizobium sp. NBSH29]QPC88991.1 TolC family protein [Mesorhizobium sp. NBSH29]
MIGLARLSILATSALLAGCATSGTLDVSDPKAGFTAVAGRTTSVTGQQPVWIQSNAEAQATADKIRSLVRGKTIDADLAVKVALLNNKGLQAAYADIGTSAAELWQESLPVNPSFGIGVTGIDPVRVIESAVVTNIMSAITRRRRMAVADARFRQAQLVAAEATLRLAADTRRAWINAVASNEALGYLYKAQQTADAASELAKKLGETGAFPKTAQAREHVLYAELAGQSASARLEARNAREALNRAMGLWGADIDYKLPGSLSKLPARGADKRAIEAEALRNRVDLEIARLELEALAQSYGLTKATRYVSDVNLLAGVEVERETEEAEEEGTSPKTKTEVLPVIDLEFTIPIFDTGQARMRQSEMAYMRAANLLAERAVNIRSEARQAHNARQATYDIARHYRNSVVPLRTAIAEQATLTYNGMITNTFELLADTRARTDSLLQSVNAKRDFWLADAALATAVYGGGGVPAEAGGGEATPAAVSAGGGH